jgi:ATP-dependent exoDNAse (exonuclease V) beta subunit
MPSTLLTTLKIANAHERDESLLFDEPSHKYTITTDPDSTYTSVTTFNHHHFPKFDAVGTIEKMMKGKNWNSDNKYWGLTSEQIQEQWAENGKAVSGAGTELHYDIECFMNQPVPNATHQTLLDYFEANPPEYINESIEWKYFMYFIKSFPTLKPYRTEWMIYDEDLKLAGSIDMVYENPETGVLTIFDWKRAKEISKTNGWGKSATTECINHLPDSNFWHYSLQLNTYKKILQTKYGKTVNELYLVSLHPNNKRGTYDLIKCADLSKEVDDLFAMRRAEVASLVGSH